MTVSGLISLSDEITNVIVEPGLAGLLALAPQKSTSLQSEQDRTEEMWTSDEHQAND